MKNDDRRLRRLVVGDATWLWTVRQRTDGLTLTFVPEWSRRRFRLVFRPGPDRLVSNTYFDAGAVVRLPDRTCLNLFEPGTVRRLLDAALPSFTGDQHVVEVDGWPYFDAVVDAGRD